MLFRTIPALFLAFTLLVPAKSSADPRWLIRVLPGSYPDVVYYVPTEAAMVALTIDDGPDPETTPQILDLLSKHSATATFFLLSDHIPGNEELVERILAEGHELGHHMTSDEVSAKLPDVELEAKFLQAMQALEHYTDLRWFRPGSGRYNDKMRELAAAHGYRIALASVPPLDTVFQSPKRMSRMVDRWAEPGSVFVLHDRGDRGHRTVATLQDLLPRLADRGLAVRSLGEVDNSSENQ